MLNKICQFLKLLVKVNPNTEQETDEIIRAVGGLKNIVHSGACATRLRLQLSNTTDVDVAFLKHHGAIGVVFIDAHNVQIIYGLKANNYAQVIDEKLQAS